MLLRGRISRKGTMPIVRHCTFDVMDITPWKIVQHCNRPIVQHCGVNFVVQSTCDTTTHNVPFAEKCGVWFATTITSEMSSSMNLTLARPYGERLASKLPVSTAFTPKALSCAFFHSQHSSMPLRCFTTCGGDPDRTTESFSWLW